MPLCGITETSFDAESVEVVHSDVLMKADDALYQAKNTGKNKVVVN